MAQDRNRVPLGSPSVTSPSGIRNLEDQVDQVRKAVDGLQGQDGQDGLDGLSARLDNLDGQVQDQDDRIVILEGNQVRFPGRVQGQVTGNPGDTFATLTWQPASSSDDVDFVLIYWFVEDVNELPDGDTDVTSTSISLESVKSAQPTTSFNGSARVPVPQTSAPSTFQYFMVPYVDGSPAGERYLVGGAVSASNGVVIPQEYNRMFNLRCTYAPNGPTVLYWNNLSGVEVNLYVNGLFYKTLDTVSGTPFYYSMGSPLGVNTYSVAPVHEGQEGVMSYPLTVVVHEPYTGPITPGTKNVGSPTLFAPTRYNDSNGKLNFITLSWTRPADMTTDPTGYPNSFPAAGYSIYMYESADAADGALLDTVQQSDDPGSTGANWNFVPTGPGTYYLGVASYGYDDEGNELHSNDVREDRNGNPLTFVLTAEDFA